MQPNGERTISKAEMALIAFLPEKRVGSVMVFARDLQQELSLSIKTSQFANNMLDEKVELGNMLDLARQFVVANPLILTNKNLMLFYSRGLFRKKSAVIVLPIAYAKSVQLKGRGRTLEILFEVQKTNEEGVMGFEIWIWHPALSESDLENWLVNINQLITESHIS